jgi:DNA-directed RNA polymerase subunit RPC12/RpoP
LKTLPILILFFALLIAIVSATSTLIPQSPLLPGIAILEFGALLFGLFGWFSRRYAYQCARCERHFALSTISNIMAINAIDTRFVKCPACGQSDFAKSFPRTEIKDEIIRPRQVKLPEDGNWRGFYMQIALLSFIYLLYLIAIVIMGHNANGYLNANSKDFAYHQSVSYSVSHIQYRLTGASSAISALFILYLAAFISAIRQRYRTDLHTALTVIFSVIILVLLLIEYSYFKDFINGIGNISS